MLRFHPAIFAVEDGYQITVITDAASFIEIRVADKVFTDDSNGILRSSSTCHKFNIPGNLLDSQGGYTVTETEIIERLAYFTKTGMVSEYSYSFRPVPDENIRIYHIADTHNNVDAPVKAAENYGKTDLLILNGDIPEDSSTVSNFDTIYDICSRITGGEIPCVFARGNHDLRGVAAEFHSLYMPDRNGCSYFTFKAGRVRGICLDCGEDKRDDNPEYGGTVACHSFRLRETEYIEKTVCEDSAPDTDYKLIVVHVPFIHRYAPPFDIEEEIYRRWASLLKEYKPDLMLCGHEHRYRLVYPGEEYDDYGLPCPMLIGAKNQDGCFGGAGIEFTGKTAKVTLTDSSGQSEEFEIKL